ncbi:MAG: choice-of-anchor J domain-containing protein [Bacteroidales bacterium]|nr:choice-of-anchor J domain-containing protein [Bacteroidales bacterium]
MRKKLLFFALFALIMQTTFAQSYLVDETFNTYPPTNWTAAKGILNVSSTITGTSSSWILDDFANIVANGKSAKVNIYGISVNDWMFTPSLNLSASETYTLDFDLALTNWNGTNSTSLGVDDKFAVVISTDNGATWSSDNILQLWTSTEVISSTGDHISIPLTGYSGNIKIGFYCESTTSNADNDIFVDNVQVFYTPTIPVFTIDFSNFDFGSLIIGDPAPNQDFVISNAGIGTINILSSQVTITGTDAADFILADIPADIALNQGDEYTINVTFDPQTGGSKSATLQIIDDITKETHEIALSGVAFPAGSLIETFDGNFLPEGWSMEGNWYKATFTGADDSYSAYLSGPGTTYTDLRLITPKVSLTGTENLTFFAKTSAFSDEPSLKIQYSTDKITWNDVTGSEIATLPYDWTLYSVDLSTVTADNYYLAFSGSGLSYKNIYVDNIMGPVIFVEAPGAAEVVSPADMATDIELDANLEWQAGSTGGIPTSYKLYLGSETGNYNIVNGDIVTSAYTPVDLFDYETTYFWKIQPSNATGELDISLCPEWSFTTIVDPTVTIPYFEDFEGLSFSLPDDWQGNSFLTVDEHGVDESTGLCIDLWSSTPTGNIITMPLTGITTATELTFDYRIVDYTSYPTTPTVLGDDKIEIIISIDGGNTWEEPIYTINSSNHITSLDFAKISIDLAEYENEDIMIKILATWAAGDFFFDVDNFSVDFKKYATIFNVDLNNQIAVGDFDPMNDTVYISGSFKTWVEPGLDSTLVLTDEDTDGIYSLALNLYEDSYEYKYFMNSGWEGGEWSGGDNRSFILTNETLTLNDVWANEYLITFNVTDGTDPLEEANISINSVDLTTNAAGNALINLTNDTYSFTVTLSDYETYTNDVIVASDNQTVNVVLNHLEIDETNSNVVIYPNPAKDFVTLQNVQENSKILILSLDGKVLIEQNVQNNSQIDISSLNSGIYLIKIEINNNSIIKQIIKI